MISSRLAINHQLHGSSSTSTCTTQSSLCHGPAALTNLDGEVRTKNGSESNTYAGGCRRCIVLDDKTQRKLRLTLRVKRQLPEGASHTRAAASSDPVTTQLRAPGPTSPLLLRLPGHKNAAHRTAPCAHTRPHTARRSFLGTHRAPAPGFTLGRTLFTLLWGTSFFGAPCGRRVWPGRTGGG